MAARPLGIRGDGAGWIRVVLVAGTLCTGIAWLGGCGPQGKDPGGTVRSFGPHAGRVGAARALPRRGGSGSPPPAAGGAARDRRPADKVHPALRVYLEPGAPDPTIRVIVSLRDTFTITPFPDPPDEAKTPAKAAAAGRLWAGAPEFLAPLLSARAADYDTLVADLVERHRGAAVRPLWLNRAVAMDIPAREVRRLAARRDAIYIEPARSGETPPQDADTAMVREESGVEPFVTAGEGYEKGLVALLDTGVRATHRLLQGTGNIRARRDCIDGDEDCGGSDAAPGEACPGSDGHATAVASVLTANDELGDEHRGVTDVRIDSYRVYYDSLVAGMCAPYLDTEAAARAMAIAAARGARVILVETQGEAGSSAALAGAADRAFEAGCVVLAPVGNTGSGDVRAPANARGALGIGAYDAESGEWYSGQSYGLTEDGRPKPDFIAATGAVAASGRSDDALTAIHKTSGAAPVATGVAVVLRNLLRGSASRIAPGNVYAAMFAAADTAMGKFDYQRDRHGAGRLSLPDDFDAEPGHVDLAEGEVQDYTLGKLGKEGVRRLRVAIWWADPLMVDDEGYATDTHGDVNLELLRISPGGEEELVAESSLGAGTYERVEARITGSRDDEWVFRITAHSVPSGKQRVHWAWIAEY